MTHSYSLVIPAWNAAATIAEAIGSVLCQSAPPAQIIVVDDGSTDGTSDIVRSLDGPVILLRQPNQGPGAATTAGLAAVERPLVAMLDADDLWLPGKAELQIGLLAADPALDGVLGPARQFRDGEPDNGSGPVQDVWGRTTLMIRTESARRIGPIVDPPGGRGEMVDWLARARDLGMRLQMLAQPVALRRIRPDSLSNRRDPRKDAGYLHVVKRALDRRRGGPS